MHIHLFTLLTLVDAGNSTAVRLASGAVSWQRSSTFSEVCTLKPRKLKWPNGLDQSKILSCSFGVYGLLRWTNPLTTLEDASRILGCSMAANTENRKEQSLFCFWVQERLTKRTLESVERPGSPKDTFEQSPA
jgi:hypothetical protein